MLQVFSCLSASWVFGLLAVYLVICYIITHFFQAGKIDLFYSEDKASRMAKIVDQSTLRTHEYVPYTLAWVNHIQGAMLIPMVNIY